MFEAEVEMEKRSTFLPLLLMMCLVVAIVGLIGYVIVQVKGQQ
jgi:preprotein translocase subunit Sss1